MTRIAARLSSGKIQIPRAWSVVFAVPLKASVPHGTEVRIPRFHKSSGGFTDAGVTPHQPGPAATTPGSLRVGRQAKSVPRAAGHLTRPSARSGTRSLPVRPRFASTPHGSASPTGAPLRSSVSAFNDRRAHHGDPGSFLTCLDLR